MGPFKAPLAVLLSALCIHASNVVNVHHQQDDSSSPMVAFFCKKPAMFLRKGVWERDESTDCLDKPLEILKFCKKVYPELDVTNVVEANEKVTISEWCGYKHKHCKHHGSHTVRPFRCLVGPFQSDALLVPEHCEFDHIHDAKQCQSSKSWEHTAHKNCVSRGMIMQSSAILLPCGLDVFSGVEFVCCPKATDQDKDYNAVGSKHTEVKDIKKPVNKEIPEPVLDNTVPHKVEKYPTYLVEDDKKIHDKNDVHFSKDEKKYDDEEEYDDDDDYQEDDDDDDDQEDDDDDDDDKKKPDMPKKDAYDQYLHDPDHFLNEHQSFLQAKNELQKRHHEKITNMMKDWAAARQRVQEISNVDPKGGDKLNKEITARFQKTYEALEQEGTAEKAQLVALHQQRVQADLNTRKRHAMEKYMAMLQDPKPQASLILKNLKHYIKVEQKDRMHTVNHLKHLYDVDPTKAEATKQQKLDHLKIIDQRIRQSIDMLKRVPAFEKKIRLQIEEFLQDFSEIDKALAKMLSQLPPKKEETEGKPVSNKLPKEDETVNKDLHHVPLAKDETNVKSMKDESKSEEDNTSEDVSSEEDDEDDDDEEGDEASDEKATDVDDIYQKEHAYVDIKKPLHSNREFNSLQLQLESVESKFNKANSAHHMINYNVGSVLGIAVGAVAAFVIIVVGIVVLRKRAHHAPSSHGFVEVDHVASPEERHVANMQINGYENPTYKYFEMNTSNA